MMVEASCHCGAIRFATETVPEAVNDCSCSICRRYSALWAYYKPADVRFAADNGPADSYIWGDRTIEFHRCRSCGCVTHWRAINSIWPEMGVNTRMMAAEVIAGVPVLRDGEPSSHQN